jgi:hypothetical protein
MQQPQLVAHALQGQHPGHVVRLARGHVRQVSADMAQLHQRLPQLALHPCLEGLQARGGLVHLGLQRAVGLTHGRLQLLQPLLQGREAAARDWPVV